MDADNARMHIKQHAYGTRQRYDIDVLGRGPRKEGLRIGHGIYSASNSAARYRTHAIAVEPFPIVLHVGLALRVSKRHLGACRADTMVSWR